MDLIRAERDREFGRFRVAELVLFRSELCAGGSVYTPLVRVGLGPAGLRHPTRARRPAEAVPVPIIRPERKEPRDNALIAASLQHGHHPKPEGENMAASKPIRNLDPEAARKDQAHPARSRANREAVRQGLGHAPRRGPGHRHRGHLHRLPVARPRPRRRGHRPGPHRRDLRPRIRAARRPSPCTSSPTPRRTAERRAFIDAEHALDPSCARKLGVMVETCSSASRTRAKRRSRSPRCSSSRTRST